MLRCPLYYVLCREDEKRQHKRVIDILFWSGPTPDREFSEFWRRRIPLLPEYLHRVLWRFLHVTAWYWERTDNMKMHVVNLARSENHFSARMNSGRYHGASLLTTGDNQKLQACLESLGVSQGSRIALIHIRNSVHDVLSGLKGPYDQECVNASPKKFQLAVDFLRNDGYSVLTVGNHPSSPSGLNGVIEYHRSPLRTALLDFLIGSRASLFLGTAFGALSGVAFHFRLPALLTDHLLWNSEITAEPFSYGRASFLLKNVCHDGTSLSQSEVLRGGFLVSDQSLSKSGVTLSENTEEEILDGLKELLAWGDSAEPWSLARKGSEQNEFWRIFDAHTRLERVCKEDGAIISPSFLKQNPHWLR